MCSSEDEKSKVFERYKAILAGFTCIFDRILRNYGGLCYAALFLLSHPLPSLYVMIMAKPLHGAWILGRAACRKKFAVSSQFYKPVSHQEFQIVADPKFANKSDRKSLCYYVENAPEPEPLQNKC